MTSSTHPSGPAVRDVDVCVIGGGQSGLALGFYLRRSIERGAAKVDGSPASFVLLDDGPGPGGAWRDAWDSLTLFSPAAYSSLAGRPMPPWPHEGNPSAEHVEAYLRDYEDRYDLPVQRPHRVEEVRVDPQRDDRLEVVTDRGATWRARVVVNATGTWARPFRPRFPGADVFAGVQVHTVDYRAPSSLPGRRVLVVGGGNSGAQIAADLVLHSDKRVTWAARVPPRFLPDDVDGRALFAVATRGVQDRARGRPNAGVSDLGDVVAVPAVREARDRHGLRATSMPDRLTETGACWDNGHERDFDAVVWCTGFRPALRHLHALDLARHEGRPDVAPPSPGSAAAVAVADPRVFFIGYGDWCAPASATLIGVNRAARDTATAVQERLAQDHARA